MHLTIGRGDLPVFAALRDTLAGWKSSTRRSTWPWGCSLRGSPSMWSTGSCTRIGSRRSRTALPRVCRPGDRLGGVEIFYTSLLVVVGLVIAWFAFYVVYRLLQEDR